MEEAQIKFVELTREWDNELTLQYKNLIKRLDYFTRLKLRLSPNFEENIIILNNVGCDELELLAFSYSKGMFNNLIDNLIQFNKQHLTTSSLSFEAFNNYFVEIFIPIFLKFFGSIGETIKFIKDNNLIAILYQRVVAEGY